MFKSVLVIFAIAAAIKQTESIMNMDEAREFVKELANTCVPEVGATPDDIAELTAHAPKTKGAKCLAACMFKGMGMIQDGKYSIEGIIEGSKRIHEEGSALHEKVKEIAVACGSIVDADECELAAKSLACGMPKFQAAGVELPY